jgi:hypothetical protein
MNDRADPMLQAMLSSYARSLREIRPSAQLDGRIEAALAGLPRLTRDRERSATAVLRWATAACVALILISALLLAGNRQRGPFDRAQDRSGHWAADQLSRASPRSGLRDERAATGDLRTTDGIAANNNAVPGRLTNRASPAWATTQPSLFPTDAAVFRVRTSLDSAAVGLRQRESLIPEHQVWVDVRIANDGSTRIERIVSTDGTEWFGQ